MESITFGPPDVGAFLDEAPALVRRFLHEIDPPEPLCQCALPGFRRRRRYKEQTASERRRMLRNLCANALPWLPGGEERLARDPDLDRHDADMARWAIDWARREGEKLLGGIPPDRLWDAWGDLGPAVQRRMDEAALRQILQSTLGDDGFSDVWPRW